MAPTPNDFLQNLDDPVNASRFVDSANTSATAEMNRTRVASQIYLAHKTKAAGENLGNALQSFAASLERALADHAEALKNAAKASERYARGLNRATWSLVFVTFALVVVTLLQWLKVK